MRKQKKYHYIYKTTNLLSGKYYIGMHSTNNLNDGYMGSGTRLRRSINKHGKENHKVEILEFINSREELKKREEEIVNLNEIAKVDCMNLKVGGYGGISNKEHMKSFLKAGKQNLVNSKEKRETTLKERRKDSEWLKNLSDNISNSLVEYYQSNDGSFKGKSHTNETKDKMSETMKGKGTGNTNSQYGTCWITNGAESKKIKKEDLETYTSDGWERGRKMKNGGEV